MSLTCKAWAQSQVHAYQMYLYTAEDYWLVTALHYLYNLHNLHLANWHSACTSDKG